MNNLVDHMHVNTDLSSLNEERNSHPQRLMSEATQKKKKMSFLKLRR